MMGVGGVYTCRAEGKEYACTARKKLKADGRLTVGDLVEIEQTDSGWAIERIYPAKNRLIRPAVSNVDQLLLLVTDPPKADLLTVDKLLILLAREGVPVIIGLSKADILPEKTVETMVSQYGNTHTVLPFSVRTKEGLDELLRLLGGKITAFAGQSAVGKSSLLNALTGESAETGALSKIDRGRQTTRKTQLFLIDEDTMIADTPGFSNLATDYLCFTTEDVACAYPEYDELAEGCRFHGCTHTEEPDCAVHRAADAGECNAERYARFVTLYREARLQEKKTSW